MSNRSIIYTAIFGDVDILKEPEYVDPRFEYVCFTEHPHRLRSAIWKVHKVQSKHTNPRREARWYKMMPHRLFGHTEISIWMDANFCPTGNIGELVYNSLKDYPIAMFAHPLRNCLYAEADICIWGGLDRIPVIERQIEAYRTAGYPTEHGLVASGIILRKHDHPEVVAGMENWWSEVEKHSSRDQLSFNYVAWSRKLEYGIIPGNIFGNAYFQYRIHGT